MQKARLLGAFDGTKHVCETNAERGLSTNKLLSPLTRLPNR